MELFGLTHLLTVGVIVALCFWCIRATRKGQSWPIASLAFICLAAYPISQAAYLTFPFAVPLDNTLPFHLCDIAAITAGFALLTRKPLLGELTYCWGLAGTLQALITPNLHNTFPHPVYFTFFLHHGAIVITALLLPLALRWRPREGIVLRMLGWNQVYFGLALTVNLLLGTNFGFLMEPPAAGSLMDHFGPWPWYLIPLQILAIVFIIFLNLPFCRSINIWRGGRNEAKPKA